MPDNNSSTTAGDPMLTLPSYEQVATDGTVAVAGASYTDSFAQGNAGSLYLGISDASGLLYGFEPGGVPAPGSGSDSIIFQGSYSDVEAIINSLTYVASGNGGSDGIQYDIWNQAGVQTTGTVPVTVSGTTTTTPPASTTVSGAPTLTEPGSESVAAGATVAISGSYTDSYAAAGSPGMLYLSITDGSGTLQATNAAGQAVAGSGTGSIALSADDTDVNAILHSLTYTAGGTAGSDNVAFDIWNQGGVQTTDTVPISITGGGSSGASGSNPITETWIGAVSSDWNTAGNWSGGVVPASGDTVVIDGGTANAPILSDATLTGETVTLAGNASTLASVTFNDVVLDSELQASGDGQVQIGGTLTVGAAGTVTPLTGGSLTLAGTGDTIVNNGLLLSTANGDLDITNGPSSGTAGATLVNDGSIAVDGGYITLASAAPGFGALPDWTLQNAGSIAIAAGGNLVLDGTVMGGTIAFAGTGALTLEQPMALAGGAVVAGFTQGDQIDPATAAAGKDGQIGFANGTLEVTTGGTLVQAIALSGSYTLGNFENYVVGGSGNTAEIVYAPGGAPSGIISPDIVAPAEASVAQGTTLALNDVSIENLGTAGSLSITAGSGSLYMTGASGSGTDHLTLGLTSASQVNADLARLSYVPAAGTSTDTVSVTATPQAPVNTTRSIPISVTGGSGGGGTALNEPASATVSPNASIAVSGSYTDSFAANNPGALYLGISDGTGTLAATNAAGQAVAGSGSNSIAVSTDYVDLNAILASLQYTAGSSAGSDTISYDVWNQAGTETTGATAVTIDPPTPGSSTSQGAAMTMADFTPISASTTSNLTGSGNSGSGAVGSISLGDSASPPIGIPMTLGQ